MKIKTSELLGPALDWAVAKCLHLTLVEHQGRWYLPGYCGEYWSTQQYINSLKEWRPSTDWSDGGPIIERKNIEITGSYGQQKHAQIYHGGESWSDAEGPTSLIAAMRCFVASTLGDEVKVPEELI